MSRPEVAIIDYGIGNTKSIKNALLRIGAEPKVSRAVEAIRNADAVILPGVGAFPAGMDRFHHVGLLDALTDYLSRGRPFLGICLGMQMLFETSNEFEERRGLGLIPGSVSKIPLPEDSTLRLPHIGWAPLIEPSAGRWQDGPLRDSKHKGFYFVHSYAAQPAEGIHVLAQVQYGETRFAAAVQKDHIFGMQFHPEKSAAAGLEVLHHFIEYC